MTIEDLVAGVVAFMVMEPVTYAAHRWVMHGLGWVLHRSHHRVRRASGVGPGFASGSTSGVASGLASRRASGVAAQVEANDWFPAIFAALTIMAMAVATARPGLHLVLPACVGVTAYGAAYATVHDLYIHGRFVRLPTIRPLEHLRHAHALHHRFGGEPYGMLCPIVPRELRARAAARPPAAHTLLT